MKTLDFDAPPSALKLYLRALTARKSGVLPPPESELARATLSGVQADMGRLRRYRDVCGFGEAAHLPPTYPFVLAAPLQIALLGCDAFPYPALGIVHVRNEITQHRAIGNRERLDFECLLIGPRAADKGVEFDFHTRATTAHGLAWECGSTLLRRLPRKDDRQRPAEATPDKRPRTVRWQVPPDIGRRYAAVSGDINPIHLHPLSARMLGFPRAIAHGMWTKARCVAALEAALPRGPFRVTVAFKLPILLPAEVRFSQQRRRDTIRFAVHDETGEKPHLQGQLAPL